ncbi:MAG TPA: hypothetical protein VF260_12555 [Bacilli bacterium]
MQKLKAAVALICLIVMITPQTAFAYSYGDPNKEELAEAYNTIAAKIEREPADWDGAYALLTEFKGEIALHFGDDVEQELERDFQAKNRDLALNNYQGLLVLNLLRRFTSAEQSIDDYAQAKLLLAKARGTFRVLSPLLAAKSSPETIEKLDAAFDKTILALGNPGLFGVGKKEKNPDELKKQIDIILGEITPHFAFLIDGKPISFQKYAGSHHVPEGAASATVGNNKESRVNPWVSVSVIGGVLVLMALGLWLAKKNRLF